MSAFKRKDSRFWYVWIERPGRPGLRENTFIPIDGGTPKQTELNRKLAEEYYSHRLSERIKEAISPKMRERRERRLSPGEARGRFTYIYFVEGAGGSIKIGRTVELQKRLQTLQIGHPHRLRLLAFSPAHVGLEKELHHHFRRLLIDREWFSPDDELRRFIQRVKNGEHPQVVLLDCLSMTTQSI